jgi:PD-(D/E)XK endonuclease
MCSSLAKPIPTNHPVDIGQRSEAAILAQLVSRGYRVLLPFGVNQRYDLVLESDGRFWKVQCKTGRLRNGAVRFKSVSVQSNLSRTRERGYAGDADLFAVYCPENTRVYLVPVDEVSSNINYLRVDPTRNNQTKRVRWARDYELPA